MKTCLFQELKLSNDSHKAFTLIELLVVIAIIGILASVVVVNVGSGRIKARDAKRISDLKAVQTALEMYYDQNGDYPGAGAFSVWDSRGHDTRDDWMDDNWGTSNLYSGLTSNNLLTTLPEDPSNFEAGTGNFLGDGSIIDRGYLYESTADNQGYIIGTNLETNQLRNFPDGGGNHCGNYQIRVNSSC